ncbi:MAG: amino acid adenylation domain-containing protein [Alteromonadaceae bacterium]|nr:amino acid adenylation domain-containing protein [Alteromonadaceae bacterium]
MNVQDLASRLKKAGVKLQVDGDQLKYTAPKGALTEEMLSMMKGAKTELLRYVAQQSHLNKISNTDTPVRCSSPQLRILASHWLTKQEAVYNEQVVLCLSGELNIEALKNAFKKIISRHDVLKLSPDEEGALRFKEHEPFEVDYVAIDSREVEVLHEELSEHRTREFDIENDRLLRVRLIKTPGLSHYLSIVTHHFIGDAWSEQIMLTELRQFYNMEATGQSKTTEKASIQYQDFCQWQAKAVELGCFDEALDRASKRLQDIPSLHSLPLDNPRCAMQSFKGQTVKRNFDRQLRAKVQEFCAKQNLTEFVMLNACFALLLSRYSNDNSISLGVPVAGRPLPELEQTIGMFTNNIVLNYKVIDSSNFLGFISSHKNMVMEALEDQFLPFELLVEKHALERDLSITPLFQIMFNMRDYEFPEKGWHDLEVEQYSIDPKVAKYDLMLLVDINDSGYCCQWQFNSELFDKTTIERWSGEFVELVEQVLDKPKATLENLHLTSSQANILIAQPTKKYRKKTLSELIFKPAHDEIPTALRFERQSLSYGQLASMTDTICANLQEQGVTRGVRVGVTLSRSIYQVPLVISLLKIGAVYVPIDVTAPNARIEYILQDSECAAHIVDDGTVTPLDIDVLRIPIGRLLKSPPDLAYVLPTLDNVIPAYVLYTSGTTGKPKGVEVSHEALVNQLLGCCEILALNKSTRLFGTTSFSFDMSLIELFAPLLVGGSVVIASENEQKYAENIARALDAYSINVYQSTPSRLQLLLAAGWKPSNDITIISGGEPLLPQLSQNLLSQGVRLFNGYGPTEICVYAMLKELKSDAEIPTLALLSNPLPNYGLCILRSDQLVPQGVVGELAVFGSGVANGYLNLPQLNEQKFKEINLNGQIVRAYLTGDEVRSMGSGELQFLGRKDNQIKLLGYRVELEEIQQTALSMAGVEAAYACLIENTYSAEVVLFVLTAREQLFKLSDIEKFLSTTLPTYMLPAQIVTVDELPTTPNGKADWSALVIDFEQGRGNSEPTKMNEDFAPELYEIWVNKLGMRSISPTASFFKSGGDSLVLMRMLREINRVFEINLTIKELYESPTFNQLNSLISEEVKKKESLKNIMLENDLEAGEGIWI